ncbi:manganese superoxide dismutase [Lactarius indigo]|nr:manganese superoxide dismutase [Lactarius indigo]
MLSTTFRVRVPLVRALAHRSAAIHTLPKLPYAYDVSAVSPPSWSCHHSKHHQAYVNGLNAAEEAFVKAPSTREKIALQPALKFNGGGHINHTLFWKNLAPVKEGGGILRDGKLKAAIERDFGSVEAFKKQFNAATAGIQGAAGAGSRTTPLRKFLEIVTTPNQDPLLAHVPIIGVDIWEHYKNVKADYLGAIWNVINFEEAEARFAEAA